MWRVLVDIEHTIQLLDPHGEHTAMTEEEIEARVREKLELVELSGIEEKMPSDLSGGMKKRVALARSIALEIVNLVGRASVNLVVIWNRHDIESQKPNDSILRGYDNACYRRSRLRW